jgi:hypothetical protein
LITEVKDYTLTVTMENPWEKEVFDWINQTYGPNYFRQLILKTLDSKSEAKIFIEVKKEVEERGSNRRATRASVGSERVNNPGPSESVEGSHGKVSDS